MSEVSVLRALVECIHTNPEKRAEITSKLSMGYELEFNILLSDPTKIIVKLGDWHAEITPRFGGSCHVDCADPETRRLLCETLYMYKIEVEGIYEFGVGH